MGQDPGTIRREIEDTRSQMGDTVEALGYKADVPTRAKESVQDKVDAVKSKFTGAAGRVSDATPDADDVRGQARQAVSTAQANPLGLAIGSLAAGFIAGMLIPETQKEHEKLGEMSDQVTDQLRDTAQQALDHGKQAAQQVAEQTAQAAKETAQHAAQEHGEQLKETARENAEQVTS